MHLDSFKSIVGTAPSPPSPQRGRGRGEGRDGAVPTILPLPPHLNHSICSPLRTYNTMNNLTYTLHTPLKHRMLHANTLPMPLHTYKVQNFTYLLSSLLACIHA